MRKEALQGSHKITWTEEVITTDNKNETAEWLPSIRRLNRKVLVLKICILFQGICILILVLRHLKIIYILSQLTEIVGLLGERIKNPISVMAESFRSVINPRQ